jgi:mRNA-degrading endonuclease RelE of RelBE toxin-antitoxin system
LTERVQFSKRATKDIERFDRGVRDRIRAALAGLVGSPMRPNLDIRPLAGRSPWLRLRGGSTRVILRQLSLAELRALGRKPPAYLVERIIDRRDLDDAVRPL